MNLRQIKGLKGGVVDLRKRVPYDFPLQFREFARNANC